MSSKVTQHDPQEVAEGLWQLQDYYASRPVWFTIQTPKQEYSACLAGREECFKTCSLWTYTDEARYIVVDPVDGAKDRYMLEIGDREVAFRGIGTHRYGPDEVDQWTAHDRHRHHVIDLDVRIVD